MLLLPSLLPVCVVALRKESVDRNPPGVRICAAGAVALRKESVDRNRNHAAQLDPVRRRSPQGERG